MLIDNSTNLNIKWWIHVKVNGNVPVVYLVFNIYLLDINVISFDVDGDAESRYNVPFYNMARATWRRRAVSGNIDVFYVCWRKLSFIVIVFNRWNKENKHDQ